MSASDVLVPYSSALEATLYFHAAGAPIAYMLADHLITKEEPFAVGATFSLLARAFAYTYTVCLGHRARQLRCGRRRGCRSQLDGAAFSELHDPVADWPERRRPDRAVRSWARGAGELAGAGLIATTVSRVVGLLVRGGQRQTDVAEHMAGGPADRARSGEMSGVR